jgi:hypothetical protein
VVPGGSLDGRRLPRRVLRCPLARDRPRTTIHPHFAGKCAGRGLRLDRSVHMLSALRWRMLVERAGRVRQTFQHDPHGGGDGRARTCGGHGLGRTDGADGSARGVRISRVPGRLCAVSRRAQAASSHRRGRTEPAPRVFSGAALAPFSEAAACNASRRNCELWAHKPGG